MSDRDREARRDHRAIEALWDTCGVGIWLIANFGHTVSPPGDVQAAGAGVA